MNIIYQHGNEILQDEYNVEGLMKYTYKYVGKNIYKTISKTEHKQVK